MYSLPGDDPCIYVEKDATQVLRFRSVCTSPYWALEEIDTEDMFEVVTPPSGPYNFNYFINNTDLVMSEQISAEVKLLRFNFDIFVWQTSVHMLSSKEEFTGEATYEFSLVMGDERALGHIVGGRLYYEVFMASTPT